MSDLHFKFSRLLSEADSVLYSLSAFSDSAVVADLQKAVDDVKTTLCRSCRSGDRDTKKCWRCEVEE